MAHAITGGHLQVPNVQELAQSGELVPERYVRTEEGSADVVVVTGCPLPVVDLGRLLDPKSSQEELVNLGSACQQGFFQILSNGKYKSVEHRAVVHPDKEPISAALFHQPLDSITVEPLPELVNKDGSGARYKSVGYAEFMSRFFSAKLSGRKSHLDHFKIY